MSALFPESKRYESSPFKRIHNPPRLVPDSPTRSSNIHSRSNGASFSHFTPSSQKSPFSKRTATFEDRGRQRSYEQRGLGASKQFLSTDSLSSNLSTNTDSTTIRRSHTARQTAGPPRSPVKLRATANRLARQTNDILSTLDSTHLSSSSSSNNLSSASSAPAKRNLAQRSPPKLYPSESENCGPLKRRKVVSFEEKDKKDENSELRSAVLTLQEQVIGMQKEHNEQMSDLRKMVAEQNRLISELLSRH